MSWRFCFLSVKTSSRVVHFTSLSLGGTALPSLCQKRMWLYCWTARRRWPVAFPAATMQRSTRMASRCLEPVCWTRRFSRWACYESLLAVWMWRHTQDLSFTSTSHTELILLSWHHGPLCACKDFMLRQHCFTVHSIRLHLNTSDKCSSKGFQIFKCYK